MLLYHINFGFPVIAPGTRLEVDDLDVQPRDETAAADLPGTPPFGPPDPNFQAQVFFHTPRPAADGYVTVRLRSPLGPGAYVRYRAAELPALTQWKMIQSGVYVCGIEPCTTHEGDRALRRSQGRLRDLAPGEEVYLRGRDRGALGNQIHLIEILLIGCYHFINPYHRDTEALRRISISRI